MMHALAPLPATPETLDWMAGNRRPIIAGPYVVEVEDRVMRNAIFWDGLETPTIAGFQ